MKPDLILVSEAMKKVWQEMVRQLERQQRVTTPQGLRDIFPSLPKKT